MGQTNASSLLLRAARGESVERPPVWAMRQAGRWDPEFNRLRDGRGFYEFSQDVERSARASLLPLRFGVDAIILFYDITSLPVAMGQNYTLQPERGPVPDQPIRNMTDLEKLDPCPAPASYQHIRDLLTRVKAELAGRVPVLVFAGAPFTVAAYCIGTGKDIDATRRFADSSPKVWNGLLERLETATIAFLRTLIADGADAYQLFDSWAGHLDEREYAAWAQHHHRRILGGATGVPRILFVKECPYLRSLCDSGADVISLGRRHDLARARADHPALVFQGNVDEEVLRSGSVEAVVEATRACLKAGGGHRHIVNLNHGVDRRTPVANFEAYVRTVREWTR